jgi:hypothetical protein
VKSRELTAVNEPNLLVNAVVSTAGPVGDMNASSLGVRTSLSLTYSSYKNSATVFLEAVS